MFQTTKQFLHFQQMLLPLEGRLLLRVRQHPRPHRDLVLHQAQARGHALGVLAQAVGHILAGDLGDFRPQNAGKHTIVICV